MAEILLAEILIVYRMKRKKNFLLRASVSFVLLVGFACALPVPFYNAAYSSLLFVLIFSSTLFALKFCFDESLGNIIYAGFFSYNEQHISFQLFKLFCIPLGIDAGNTLYGQENSFDDGNMSTRYKMDKKIDLKIVNGDKEIHGAEDNVYNSCPVRSSSQSCLLMTLINNNEEEIGFRYEVEYFGALGQAEMTLAPKESKTELIVISTARDTVDKAFHQLKILSGGDN